MVPRFILNFKIHMLLADLMRQGEFVLGQELINFEQNLASYLGVKYAVGVGSGTDALIYSLKALNVGPGDEVIIPAMSFAATAFAVVWVGATPRFIDIDQKTFNIHPQHIEEAINSRTKVLMPVHLHGQMADMNVISVIARKHRLFVIEDAAQAIGATYKGRQIGALSDIACLSFSLIKPLNALGGGGAIVTNNSNLAHKVSLLRNYGTDDYKMFFDHELIGTSSRLDNFQAGVLSIKLKFLNEIIAKQRRNFDLYTVLLDGVGDLILPTEIPEGFHTGYHYVIRTKYRDSLYKFLLDNKVTNVRVHYPVPLHLLRALNFVGYKPGSFPVAEAVSKEVLSLPTSCPTERRDVERIARLVHEFFKKL